MVDNGHRMMLEVANARWKGNAMTMTVNFNIARPCCTV
jgi:hypothetical protein